MRPRSFAVCILISACLVALAGSARAATYEVSTKNRYFCCSSIYIFGSPRRTGITRW